VAVLSAPQTMSAALHQTIAQAQLKLSPPAQAVAPPKLRAPTAASADSQSWRRAPSAPAAAAAGAVDQREGDHDDGHVGDDQVEEPAVAARPRQRGSGGSGTVSMRSSVGRKRGEGCQGGVCVRASARRCVCVCVCQLDGVCVCVRSSAGRGGCPSHRRKNR
jgi:hypothetical protein